MSADVANAALWRAPVFVKIGYGPYESVYSPSEALHYLVHRWPSERGDHYESAMWRCREASEVRLPAEAARKAFIAAAVEAYLFA